MTTTIDSIIKTAATIDLTVTSTMAEPTAPTAPEKPDDLVLPVAPKPPTFPTMRVISYGRDKSGKKAQVTAQIDRKWMTFHCRLRSGTTYATEDGQLFDLRGLTPCGPSHAQLRREFGKMYRDWQSDCERLTSAHKHAVICYEDDMAKYKLAMAEYRRELAAYNNFVTEQKAAASV